MNELSRKRLCPYCSALVKFDEFSTKTFSGGNKKISVLVKRCPECKRILGVRVPINHQIERAG